MQIPPNLNHSKPDWTAGAVDMLDHVTSLEKAAWEEFRNDSFTISVFHRDQPVSVPAQLVCEAYKLLPAIVWAGVENMPFEAVFRRAPTWDTVILGYHIIAGAERVSFSRVRSMLGSGSPLSLDKLMDSFQVSEAHYSGRRVNLFDWKWVVPAHLVAQSIVNLGN